MTVSVSLTHDIARPGRYITNGDSGEDYGAFWGNQVFYYEETENFKENFDDMKVAVSTKIWFTGAGGKSTGEQG